MAGTAGTTKMDELERARGALVAVCAALGRDRTPVLFREKTLGATSHAADLIAAAIRLLDAELLDLAARRCTACGHFLGCESRVSHRCP